VAAITTSTPAEVEAMPDEDTIVKGAVRTDFILSAEIMVISLNEVASEGFVNRAIILIVVAIAITVAVYGFVACW
jgi:predicted DNA repair protein MutK